MAQPPPAGLATRAFTPIRNPIYTQSMDDSFKRPQPQNVLERQMHTGGVDARLTSQGTIPPVGGLTPIVPAAYQTPHNVWALRPA